MGNQVATILHLHFEKILYKQNFNGARAQKYLQSPPLKVCMMKSSFCIQLQVGLFELGMTQPLSGNTCEFVVLLHVTINILHYIVLHVVTSKKHTHYERNGKKKDFLS